MFLQRLLIFHITFTSHLLRFLSHFYHRPIRFKNTAAIEKRETEKKRVEHELAELAVTRPGPEYRPNIVITPAVALEIRQEIIKELQTEDKEKLKRFVRAYIKRIDIDGVTANIEFTITKGDKCLEVSLPGAGIEPA